MTHSHLVLGASRQLAELIGKEFMVDSLWYYYAARVPYSTGESNAVLRPTQA